MITSNFHKNAVSKYYCPHFCTKESSPRKDEMVQVTLSLSDRFPSAPLVFFPTYPARILQ